MTPSNNTLASFSPEDINVMLQNLDNFSDTEVAEIYKLAEELEERQYVERCHNDLLDFTIHMDGKYITGKHHKILSNKLQKIESGEVTRLCVNIAPRHGKSHLVSTMYPAWFLGRNPSAQVMLVSHTADLAVDFGRKVRDLISSADFQRVFPGVSLSKDNKSAGRWTTSMGGVFFACGIGAKLAGRGADLLLIDDPHSEQDILNGNYDVFEKAYSWFAYGARTRLMPGGRIAIVQTRWSLDDLTGRVVKDMQMNPKTDQYEVIEFPAILNEGEKNEKALWPEFFDLDALKQIKEGMPTFQWNAQYQQDPTSEEGAIVKREWWRVWKKENPPPCEYLIMSLDSAAETNNRADFSALTTWGVFLNEEESRYEIILLNSIKERYEFPELKDRAYTEWQFWEPDCFIVEKKSSGVALYQEMRRTGIPVQEFTPHRGTGDKMARLNSVADIIRSGMVWVPETRWAEELVDEVAAFPAAPNDDLVDSCVMALMRFRSGGFIRLPSDEPDEEKYFKSKRGGYY
jgi:predicted phage terminase large subunit-like protein